MREHLHTAALLLGRGPMELARFHLMTAHAPARWTREGLLALQDLLAKGVAEVLLRAGGARQHATPEGGGHAFAAGGCALSFGDATLTLLDWLTCSPLPGGPPLRLGSALTPAEVVLVWRATLLVERIGVDLSPWPLSPDLWLLSGRRLAPRVAHPARPALATASLVAAVQPTLRREIVAWARAARTAASPELAIRHGAAQAAVLNGFLDMCEVEGRPELAGFAQDALEDLAHLDDDAWSAVAWPSAPVSVRQEARRAQVAIPALARRLASWQEAWTRVGWLDEGYDAAQWRLRRFSRAGALARRFESLLTRTESLVA